MKKTILVAILLFSGCSTVQPPPAKIDKLEKRISNLESKVIYLEYRISSSQDWEEYDIERVDSRLDSLRDSVWELERKEAGIPTLPELAKQVLKKLEK